MKPLSTTLFHPTFRILLLTSCALAPALACSSGSDPSDNTQSNLAADAGSNPGSDFQLLPEYEPAAEEPGSSAIAMGDERFVAWASDFLEPVTLGSDVDADWDDPEQALGPAEGAAEQVLSLGNGGSLTLTFAAPISNLDGPDFAVFENAFDDFFLELAFVEVSSNGEDFLRFDCAYLGEEPIGQYDTHNTELIGGLAGKYRAGFGTPFDLELLSDKDAVQQGDVDLNTITQIKVVDIIGDGSQHDSFGSPIYDPTPTVISGGFDLDAVGVIHAGQ